MKRELALLAVALLLPLLTYGAITWHRQSARAAALEGGARDVSKRQELLIRTALERRGLIRGRVVPAELASIPKPAVLVFTRSMENEADFALWRSALAKAPGISLVFATASTDDLVNGWLKQASDQRISHQKVNPEFLTAINAMGNRVALSIDSAGILKQIHLQESVKTPPEFAQVALRDAR